MFKRFWWIFPVCLITFLLAGLGVAALNASVASNTYESSAVLRIGSHSPALDAFSSEPLVDSTAQITFFDNPATFEMVVDAQNLADRWSMKRTEAARRIADMTSMEKLTANEGISLSIRHRHPGRALELTEHVLEACSQRLRRREDHILRDLEAAVELQERRVYERRRSVAEFIREITSEPPSVEELESAAGGLHEDFKNLRHRDQETLLKLAAEIESPGNPVRNLYPRYLEAKKQLKALKNAGAEIDPKIIDTQSGILQSLQRELFSHLDILRDTLRSRLKRIGRQRARLEENPANSRSAQTPDMAYPIAQEKEFEEAREKFETARRRLEELSINLISHEMSSRPDYFTVVKNPGLPETSIAHSLRRRIVTCTGIGLLIGITTPFLLIPLLHNLSKPSPA